MASQDPACDLQGTAKGLTCSRLSFGRLSLVRGKIFNLEPVPVNHCQTAGGTCAASHAGQRHVQRCCPSGTSTGCSPGH